MDIVILVERSGREIALDVGESRVVPTSGCYEFGFVARSAADDRVLARSDETVCDGQTWTVYGQDNAELTDG